MRRKIVASMMILGLCLSQSACGLSHTHVETNGWEADLGEHWKTCACGARFDAGTHTVEEEMCTVCGNGIVVWEDGAGDVRIYNEHGDYARYISYAADGSVVYAEEYEYTYDEAGNLLTEKIVSGERVISEYTFGLTADGGRYIAEDNHHHEDGGRECNTYNEKSETLTSHSYAPDGSVEWAYLYEYNETGTWMSEKYYQGEMLVTEREYWMGDGEQSLLKEINYNEDGSWIGIEYDVFDNPVIEIHSDELGRVILDRRFVHDYDADGNILKTTTYDNGALVQEMEFYFGSDESGSWSMSGKTITYCEDGSKVIRDGDPEGTWSRETTYAPDGSVVEELRYEYEYDENGESVSSRGYRNGKIFEEAGRISGPDGEAIGIYMISYAENGAKTVREYNDSFDLVKETVYDVVGNVISETQPD